MKKKPEFMEHKLSRRERQIIDVIFELGEASVAEVMDRIPNPPTDSAVRSALNILLKKGLVISQYKGPRKVYRLNFQTDKAQKTASQRFVKTYFKGSTSLALASLIDAREQDIDKNEWDSIMNLIEKARSEGN